jgi:hypothetical protein
VGVIAPPRRCTRVSKASRFLMLLAALVLAGMYFVPVWHIALKAPQYPEGLGMQIRLSTITGDEPHQLKNINALNHYIGMRPIEPDAIPELRFMPWIVGALVGLAIVAAIVGCRHLVQGWLVALAALALAGMVDFYRWGYDYGHNLDPNAVIQVPGMTYQPPLIGTKQLLNFTATSLPDVGAYLAFVAFLLGLLALRFARSREAEALSVASAATSRSPSGVTTPQRVRANAG